MPIGKNEKDSPISPIEHATLYLVVNQSRLVNGWTTKTREQLDATIRAWHKVFLHYKIPVGFADALYWRALDFRQTFLINGKEPPSMNAELLATGWTGKNGLKAELEERRVKKGRTLTADAESQCPKCFGSKMEIVKDKGARPCPNCDPSGFEIWRQKYER